MRDAKLQITMYKTFAFYPNKLLHYVCRYIQRVYT